MEKKTRKISVYFLAAEAVPFIKVGGLGDVAGALPQALKRLQKPNGSLLTLDIRVAIPYHFAIDQKYKEQSPVSSFSITRGNLQYPIKVFEKIIDGVPFYLFDSDLIGKTEKVYNLDASMDGDKFTLFSLAALRFPQLIHWKPDILHINDWHTAIAAHINRMDSRREKIPFSILTLHNLPFMGAGIESSLVKFRVPPSDDPDLPEWARILPLPMGLASVDRIIPVSPSYAREILKKDAGCNLHFFFRKNDAKITGILNGIDPETWNPQTDPNLAQNYGIDDLSGKAQNKRTLQAEFHFSKQDDIPLLIMVSRMDTQKGVDLIVDGLRMIAETPWQAILLGSGDPNLEEACLALAKIFPKRIRAILRFDSQLSHRLYAGGDILMMPSRYEPCGLSQMIAMRYGCIPVARSTGGLKDTISSHPLKEKTGYLFSHAKPADFSKALLTAISDFKNCSRWEKIQQNAMQKDYSWDQSAAEYARVYLEVIDKGKEQ